jgi:putative DNA primase/helicase
MGAVEAYVAGFTAQVSVMPPGAKATANSKINDLDAGKVPALKGSDGCYFGYNWMNSKPSKENVEYWVSQGSSIGFLGSHYPAVDIDITDAELSAAVTAAVIKHMGPAVIRTGRAPKRLVMFTCAEPLRSFDMHYTRWHKLLGTEDKQLIQFLGKGRQYVMFGRHPVTLVPYHIEDDALAMALGPAALPVLTVDKVVELFDVINGVMAEFGYTTTNHPEARLAGGEVNQDDLKSPSLADLGELVARMPNTTPEREEYVSVGYAIKAASQDDPEVGFSIFMDWCERWDQGANDPAVVRQDWDKMVPPYRMGHEWLMDRAKRWGAEVSDLQFGPADPRPMAGPVAPAEEEVDPEVAASRAALQAATAGDDAVLSDRWLAKKFVAQFGQSYMIPRGITNDLCLKWDGQHWVEVSRGALWEHIASFLGSHTAMARQLYENPKEGAAAAMRLGSSWTIRAIGKLVEADPRLVVEYNSLDAYPDLLDTPAGPIHLPTGELLKPDPAHRLTKTTTVAMDPSMNCPRWMQFIEEVTVGDPALAFWLQCLAGYSITGHTREQVFPFFVGPGGNGKSVFISTLSRLLGPNAVSVPVELFQLTRFGTDAAYLLASIHGARLVTTSETKAGGMWDEQRVKQVTGEDKITARVPYGKPFTFDASCTLIVAGNHSPDLDEVTDAMARRMRVMAWDFKPDAFDKLLPEKLSAELPGILAWCVQGAMAWYRHGLPECEAINAATGGYLLDQDTLGHWVRGQLEPGRRDEMLPTRDLYDNYLTWCRVNAAAPMRLSMFQKRIIGPLRDLGAVRSRSSEVRGWRNVGLKPVEGDAPSNVVNFPAVAPPPPRR